MRGLRKSLANFFRSLANLLDPDKPKEEIVPAIKESVFRKNPNHLILKNLQDFIWRNSEEKQIDEVFENIRRLFRESSVKGVWTIYCVLRGKYSLSIKDTLEKKIVILSKIYLYSLHMIELRDMYSSIADKDSVYSKLEEGFFEKGMGGVFNEIVRRYLNKKEDKRIIVDRLMLCTMFMSDRLEQIKESFNLQQLPD